MASGLITEYLGEGLTAARPATPDIPSGAIALYYSTDDNEMSAYADGAWIEDVFGTGGALLVANNLSDVASAATAATNLGLGTGDSPQFTGVNVGHASDTTITRASAGVIAVEGSNVVTVAGGVTFAADIQVPADAYDATGWNGNNEVPTKNDIRDKIESLGSGGDYVFITRQTFTTSSAIDIALPDSYDSFQIEFYSVASNDGIALNAQITDDNFTSVESGASDYAYAQSRWSSTAGQSASSATTAIVLLTALQGNAAGEYNAGKIEIINAKETSPTTLIATFNYHTTSGAYSGAHVIGDYHGANSSINGLRISPGAGTLTGFYKVWGRSV